MSLFVWLDYSERERRKMLDIVDAFREHDTRDELGIGSVRDAFADLFFPGTSTIMTRARYFLMVPWIYQRLERDRVGSAQIGQKGRRAETALIEVIEQSDDSDGNLGTRAGHALVRIPSNIYWQGLGVWGIRTFPGSQAQYYRSLDQHYVQLSRHSGRGKERDIEHDDLVTPNWHGGLVAAPAGFPKECSLRLTQEEADYLAERIRLSPMSSGSLLAELLAQRQRTDAIPFIWQHPRLGDLPEELRELIGHSQNFSEIMHGASLLYNLMLAEQTQRPELVAEYRDDFGEWAEIIAGRSAAFFSWKRARFWQLIDDANPRITPGTRSFINTWWDLALAGDTPALCDDASARTLIRERERRLKKNLARIGNPRALELWQGSSGAGQLEYRWGISQQLLNDIFSGLESRDA